MVQRCKLGLSQALDHSQNGGVDKADTEVRVGAQQLSHSSVVGHLEVLDLKCAPAAVVEKPDEGIHLWCSIQQVLDLDQCRGGHDTILAGVLERPRAREVVVIAGLDRSENYTCI